MLGSFLSCQIPGKQEAGGGTKQGPWFFLNCAAPCCIWQRLSNRWVILRRWGEKSPQAVAGRKQCAVSSGVSTGKKNVKANMPKKFLNQRETITQFSVIIYSSWNTHLRRKKKKAYQFFNSKWENNKTTNCSHGGKMQMTWKTFFCHYLPLSTATWLWTLFHWANRRSYTVPLITLESLTFIKTGNKKIANQYTKKQQKSLGKLYRDHYKFAFTNKDGWGKGKIRKVARNWCQTKVKDEVWCFF